MSQVNSMVANVNTAFGIPVWITGIVLAIAVGAVIIGGLSVAGGKGNVFGTLLGMLFFAVLANGMSLLSMSSYSQSLVKGILLLAAVYIDIVRNRAAKK